MIHLPKRILIASAAMACLVLLGAVTAVVASGTDTAFSSSASDQGATATGGGALAGASACLGRPGDHADHERDDLLERL